MEARVDVTVGTVFKLRGEQIEVKIGQITMFLIIYIQFYIGLISTSILPFRLYIWLQSGFD